MYKYKKLDTLYFDRGSFEIVYGVFRDNKRKVKFVTLCSEQAERLCRLLNSGVIKDVEL